MVFGKFIVIEGIDGAGTSTQAQCIAESLRARGMSTHTTHEPSDGPIGSMIHQVLTHRLGVRDPSGTRALAWQTMALLFAADRIDHLDVEILPNLQNGITVLCDRYDLSSVIYQSHTAGDGENIEEVAGWVRELNRKARRPDLTFVLDVDPDIAAKRRAFRSGAAELYEHAALQTRLARSYRDAERFAVGDRIIHVDGNTSRQEVTETMLKHLGEICGWDEV